MAIGHPDFSEVLSLTIQKLRPKLADNLTKRSTILRRLEGRRRSTFGPSVVFSAILETGTSTVVADASGSHSTALTGEVVGAAKVDYSNPYVTPVRVPFKSLADNASGDRIAALMAQRIEAALEDHRRKLVADFYNLSANPAGSIPSIGEVIDSTTPFAGIDPASQPAWASTEVTSSKASGQTITEALDDLVDGVYSESRKMPDLIICGQSVFRELTAALEGVVRVVDTRKGDLRTRVVEHSGIPVEWDPDCPTDHAFALNTEHIEVYVQKAEGGQELYVAPQKPIPIAGTLDTVVPIVTAMTWLVDERRAFGKLQRTA